MPKLFITLFLSCVILNIKGCSPLASVLLLKQTTAIVTLIILRFTQRFTQLPLRGYVWEHISKRCRKAKRTDNRLIINPFLPVGVTGFEPATTRPPAVERIFVFIGIGLEISGTIPCEWGDVLYLLRLSEMKSVIKM